MKPVAYYIGQLRIVDKVDHCVALLDFVKNHPTLGAKYGVRTSRLVYLPDKDGCFETLNTLYKPIEFSSTSEEFVTLVGVSNANS